ncbi:MAG: cysteine--tRNA ligase [Saccharospirillaceae bacterium]|nr:cysteine--tRNA ligase [Pseudomonadales bacterium]NRB80005.1 cysteine--tRNA ligase [Saccharospirillaceae bacterium]
MTQIKLYNSATKQKEAFTPIDENHVTMYVCGPTVYNFIHFGNARPAVIFDCLFRILNSAYPKVTYARNITDVDDKINAAALEQKVSINEFTQKFTTAYQEDMANLGNLTPTLEPKATDHIQEMLDINQVLIDKGYAYESEGHVLFDVTSNENYGKLSNRNLDDMQAGARVEVADYKKHPMDFVLWKPSDTGTTGWDSQFGFGRPGWHTECVAMINKHLGKTIDIHGGGRDLLFPHHENEQIQGQCCQSETQDYVNYWLHNGMLNIDGVKMSKSLGNFITVRELLEQHDGELLRFALLTSHYRTTLNWTKDLLTQSQQALDKFYTVLRDTQDIKAGESDINTNPVVMALYDDINTPQAIAALHQISTDLNKKEGNLELLKAQFIQGAQILGILNKDPESYFKSGDGLDEASILDFIEQRKAAKKNKDFAGADKIREELLAQGIEIKDTREGVIWQRVR